MIESSFAYATNAETHIRLDVTVDDTGLNVKENDGGNLIVSKCFVYEEERNARVRRR